MEARAYDGVIFDMDGTVIEPLLDFDAIRAELDIDPQTGILEAIAEMPPPLRARAEQRLLDHELTAARESRIMEGAEELLAACEEAGLRTALLTRNTRRAADTVMQRHPKLKFDLVLCREDGRIKPEPDGILRACRELGIAPERTVCVGDFHYDIVAANAAGARSVLLCRHENPEDLPDWADEADDVIRELVELKGILGI